MEFLYMVLGCSLCTMGYFFFRFMEFRKNELAREQELNIKVQCLLDEMKNPEQNENIFREMAISEISKQTLVYDPQSGLFVRRRQIN